MATIGARTNQLDHAEDVNTSQLQYLTSQLDDVQGVDPAKAYLEFTQQNVAYQAALQVTAKTVQATLLDFLR
jgi:flagellar hook-associated protein 3 FlgL